MPRGLLNCSKQPLPTRTTTTCIIHPRMLSHSFSLKKNQSADPQLSFLLCSGSSGSAPSSALPWPPSTTRWSSGRSRSRAGPKLLLLWDASPDRQACFGWGGHLQSLPCAVEFHFSSSLMYCSCKLIQKKVRCTALCLSEPGLVISVPNCVIRR